MTAVKFKEYSLWCVYDKSAKRDKKISVPLFLMIRLSYLTVNQCL